MNEQALNPTFPTRAGTIHRVLWASCLLLSLACGTGSEPGPDSRIRSVGVSTPGHVSGLLIDELVQLTAQAYDSAGGVLPGEATEWTSSSPAIATVTASGRVRGKSVGLVRIEATIGGVTGYTDLRVMDSVASMSLSGYLHAIVPTATFLVYADLRSSAGDSLTSDQRHLLWTSSAPGIASVDSDGRVEGLSEGTAVITLKALDENISSTFPVTVRRLTYRSVQYQGGWGPQLNGCALTVEGEVYCWGLYRPGQLHSRSGGLVPTLLDTLVFDSLSFGAEHACGLTPQGVAYCWADNSTGALGDGTTTSSWQPVAVTGGHTFISIRAGYNRTCAIGTDQVTWCWGQNQRGEFGNGTTAPSLVPVVAVPGLDLVTLTISPGITSASGPNCGITSTNELYCWGGNELGQVGNGTRSPQPTPPSLVQSPVPLIMVAAGGEHACGLAADGTALCWGNGFEGELGRSSILDSLPGAVQSGPKYSKLASGLSRTCGITAAGEVWCWGSGWGNAPIQMALPEAMVDVHVTHAKICGISATQTAYCWLVPGSVPTLELGQ
jgi:hypothetical protein